VWTLLARGCPSDAFAYLVEYEDSEKLLKLVERCATNDDEFKLGTFQFDATAAWVDKLLRKWDLAQLPNDAQFIRARTGRSNDVRTISRMPGVLSSIVYTPRATLVMVSIILD
jgi:hypothetical protein